MSSDAVDDSFSYVIFILFCSLLFSFVFISICFHFLFHFFSFLMY